MNATDQTPGRIPQRRDAHEKIARKSFIVNLGCMFLAILKKSRMWTDRRGLVRGVHAGVAGLTDTLILGEAQTLGHRLVDSHDAVLRVQDGDRVRHGVKSAFPLFERLEGGNVDPQTVAGGMLARRSPLLLDGSLRGDRA
jgi:hypothetical protein